MRLDRTRMENMLLDYLYEELEPSAREAFEDQLPLFPDLEKEVKEYQEVRSWVSDTQGAKEEPIESHRLEQIISSALAEGFPSDAGNTSHERKGMGQRLMEWIHAPQLAMAFLVTVVAGIGLYQVEKEAFISTSEVPKDDGGQPVEVSASLGQEEPRASKEGNSDEALKAHLPLEEGKMESEEFVELEMAPHPATSTFGEASPKAAPRDRRGTAGGRKSSADLSSAGNAPMKKSKPKRVKASREGLKKEKERAPLNEKLTEESFGALQEINGSLSDEPLVAGSASKKKQKVKTRSAKSAQSAPMAQSPPMAPPAAQAEATPSVVERHMAETAMGGAYMAEDQEMEAPGATPNERRLEALAHLKSGSIEKGMVILEALISARNAQSAKALTSGIQMLLSLDKVREAGALMALGEQTGNSHESWPMALEFARTLMKKGQP